MPGRQAKLIAPFTLRRMLGYTRHSQDPARDRVMILLSVKAGLRAAEIAGLDWSMVLDARACIGDTITIRDGIAKKQSGRKIPMHPDLKAALRALTPTTGLAGPVIRSARGGAMRANSIVN